MTAQWWHSTCIWATIYTKAEASIQLQLWFSGFFGGLRLRLRQSNYCIVRTKVIIMKQRKFKITVSGEYGNPKISCGNLISSIWTVYDSSKVSANIIKSN